MKNIIVLLMPIFLLAGCTSSNQYQGEYIDGSASPEAFSENWVIEHRAAPFYPTTAARNKVTGCVRFHFIVAETGQAKNIEITDSYPEGVFDGAATAALKKWRWKPLKGEDSQPVSTTLRLDFSIDAAGRTLPKEACKSATTAEG